MYSDVTNDGTHHAAGTSPLERHCLQRLRIAATVAEEAMWAAACVAAEEYARNTGALPTATATAKANGGDNSAGDSSSPALSPSFDRSIARQPSEPFKTHTTVSLQDRQLVRSTKFQLLYFMRQASCRRLKALP
jgi:hypothetical protein